MKFNINGELFPSIKRYPLENRASKGYAASMLVRTLLLGEGGWEDWGFGISKIMNLITSLPSSRRECYGGQD